MVILPPLYLSVRDDLHLSSLSQVMLLGTVYLLVYALMNLPFGILGDRFSKKNILIFGAVVNSIAFLFAARSSSYSTMMIAMVMAGIGGGAYHPVASAFISDRFREQIGRAFGLTGIGSSLGLFGGPFLSGYIGHRFGWRASCAVFAISGLIIAAVSGYLLSSGRDRTERKESEAIDLRSLALVLIPVVITFGLRDFSLWGTLYLTPAMTQMSLNFSSQSAGALIALLSIMGLISQPLSGALSDRIGHHRMICVLMTVGGAALFLFPLVNEALIYPVAALFGLTMTGTIPVIDAVAARLIPSSCRGRVFGILMTLGIMLGAVSPYMTGLMYDVTGDYMAVYSVLAVTGLLGAGSVFLVKRPADPVSSAEG